MLLISNWRPVSDGGERAYMRWYEVRRGEGRRVASQDDGQRYLSSV